MCTVARAHIPWTRNRWAVITPALALTADSSASRCRRRSAPRTRRSRRDSRRSAPRAARTRRARRRRREKSMKPDAPVIAPARPGGARRATSASCTPFQPIAVAPNSGARARRAPPPARPASDSAVATPHAPATRPISASTRARRQQAIGDARPTRCGPTTPPSVVAGQREAGGHQRPAQRLGQVDDQEARQAHLRRGVDERDQRQLDQRARCASTMRSGVNTPASDRRASGRAVGVERGARRLRCERDGEPAGRDREQRGAPAERQRQAGQHRAGERGARRNAGLLDRERERQARRRRRADQHVRRRGRDRPVADADDERRDARAARARGRARPRAATSAGDAEKHARPATRGSRRSAR